MKDESKSCPEIMERLPLYVGEDLDPVALDTVRAHLERCAECARRAEEAARARMVFRSAVQPPRDQEPAALWADVRTVLFAEGRIRSADAPLPTKLHDADRRPRLRLLRYAGSLAAAAAVVVFAFVQLDRGPAPLEIVHDTTGTDPVAVVPVLDAEQGGLRRVGPGEDRPLGDVARPARRQPAGQRASTRGGSAQVTGLKNFR